MTRISEIHGIPADEFQDRAANVAASDYIPYLSATAGEMRLLLARQRAKIFAGFYPEEKEYAQAVTMIDNALNAGISNGVSFVGALHDPFLQQVASIIKSASRQTRPASRAAFARESVLSGIGAIIPSQDRKNACMLAAKARVREKGQCRTPPYSKGSFCANLLESEYAKCEKAFKIEEILNGGIENSGHHMVYKSLPTGFQLPTEVVVKRTLHRTGVEGMALVGKIENALMYEWVENAILLKNTQVGLSPYSSPVTSLYLSSDPLKEIDRFNQLKKNKTGGIGVIDPVTGAIVVKIIGAITGAILAAAALLKALRSQEAYAMSEARGFGTDAFSGSKEDWIQSAQNPPTTAGGINPIYLLAGAAAFLLLAEDEK